MDAVIDGPVQAIRQDVARESIGDGMLLHAEETVDQATGRKHRMTRHGHAACRQRITSPPPAGCRNAALIQPRS